MIKRILKSKIFLTFVCTILVGLFVFSLVFFPTLNSQDETSNLPDSNVSTPAPNDDQITSQATGEWKDNRSSSWSTDSSGNYLISDGKQLAKLAYDVNTGASSYSGVTFKLTNNIDLSEHYWNPIGSTTTNSFRGIFDGNNYCIYGLDITGTYSSGETYIGLFGYAWNAKIQNLIVSGSINVTANAHVKIGGITGYCDYTTIQNCMSDVNINLAAFSTHNVGGITGFEYGDGSESKLSQCANSADITVTGSIVTGGYTGGIVGWCRQDSKIENCINYGNINAKSELVGGIAGYIYVDSPRDTSKAVSVYKCINTASIKKTKPDSGSSVSGNVGGLVGKLYATSTSEWVWWQFTYKYYYSEAKVIDCLSIKADALGNDSGGLNMYIANQSGGTLSGQGEWTSGRDIVNQDGFDRNIWEVHSEGTAVLISNYKNIDKYRPVLKWTYAVDNANDVKVINIGTYIESINSLTYQNSELSITYNSNISDNLKLKKLAEYRVIRTHNQITFFDILNASFYGYKYIGIYSAAAAGNRSAMDIDGGYQNIAKKDGDILSVLTYNDGTYGAYKDLPNDIGAFFNRNQLKITQIQVMKRSYVPTDISNSDFERDEDAKKLLDISIHDENSSKIVSVSPSGVSGDISGYIYDNNTALYKSTLHINVNFKPFRQYDNYEVYGLYKILDPTGYITPKFDSDLDKYLVPMTSSTNSGSGDYESLEFNILLDDLPDYINQYAIYLYITRIRQVSTLNVEYCVSDGSSESSNSSYKLDIYNGYYTEGSSKLLPDERRYHRRDFTTPYSKNIVSLNNSSKDRFFVADPISPITYEFIAELQFGESVAPTKYKIILGGLASLQQGFPSTEGFQVNDNNISLDMMFVYNKLIDVYKAASNKENMEIGKAMLMGVNDGSGYTAETIKIKFIKYVSKTSFSSTLQIYSLYENPYDPDSPLDYKTFKKGKFSQEANYFYYYNDNYLDKKSENSYQYIENGTYEQKKSELAEKYASFYEITTIHEDDYVCYNITFKISRHNVFEFDPGSTDPSGTVGDRYTVSGTDREQTLNSILTQFMNQFQTAYYSGYYIYTYKNACFFSSLDSGYDGFTENLLDTSLYDICQNYNSSLTSVYCYFTFETSDVLIELRNAAASDGIKVKIDGKLQKVSTTDQRDYTFGNSAGGYVLSLSDVKAYSLIEFEIARNFSVSDVKLTKFIGIYSAYYVGEYIPAMGEISDEDIGDKRLLSWDQNYSMRYVPVSVGGYGSEKHSFMIIIEYEDCITTNDYTEPKKVGNEYQVTNSKELYWIAIQLALPLGQNVNNFRGVTFKQMNDIQFGPNEAMIPIGYQQVPFMGTYDGQNYKIIDLNLDRILVESEILSYYTLSGVGLFGCIKNATIKNLEFENCKVTGHSNVGIAVGYAEESNIMNIRVYDSTVTNNPEYPIDEASPNYSYNLVAYDGERNIIFRYLEANTTDYKFVSAESKMRLIAGATAKGGKHISGLLCGGVENSSVEVCLSYNAVANADYDGVFIGQILYDDIADWAITYCVTNATLYDYNFNNFDFSDGENNLLETKYHCHDGQFDFNSLKSDDADPECYRKFWW